MAKKIILENVELGNTGEVSKDKINKNFNKVDEGLNTLDGEAVKKANVTVNLGFSQKDVPSEYAVSKHFKNYASKEDLKTVTTSNKGQYDTLGELQTAHPNNTNKAGDYAIVGLPPDWTIWRVKEDSGEWLDTGETPPQEEIDLSGYAKKEELATKDTRDKIISFTDEDGNVGATIDEDGVIDASGLSSRLTNSVKKDLDIATKSVSDKIISFTDEDGNVGATIDEDGVIDASGLSSRLTNSVKKDLDIATKSVSDKIISFTDEDGNVGATIDEDGVIDASGLSSRLTNSVKKDLDIATKSVSDKIISFTDEDGNVGATIDEDGVIDASGLSSRLTNSVKKDLDIATKSVSDKIISFTDEDGNVGATIDEDGVIDASGLSSRLTNSVKKDLDIATKSVSDKIISFTDEYGNVGATIDERGIIDAFGLSDRLLEFIAKKIGGIITPTEPKFLADVYLIPCYGQSLSINTSAGASTFSSVVPISYDVNLNNTNIQDMCAGTAEAFMLMSEFSGVALPPNFKMMHCLGGTGGTSIAGLSKGSAQYNNVINSVRTAKNKCDAQGLTFNVPCFTWTQGEEDMRAGGNPANYGSGNFNPYTYKNRLRQLIDDFNTDIKAITGQENDVLCISYQVASHTSYQRYPRIALQQAELAMEDDRMILAKTMYNVDYVTESDYQVHAPAKTYRNMGNMYGLAIWDVSVMQEEHRASRPIYHSINGKEIIIKFDVPYPPLVLDTQLVTQLPDNNFGFNVYNVDEQIGANGTITKSNVNIISVSLINSDTIKITLDKEPISGERLTYGINGDYWQNINGSRNITSGGEGVNGITKSGRIAGGSRGCLRDSNPIENNNAGSGYTNLYNWSIIFEIKL